MLTALHSSTSSYQGSLVLKYSGRCVTDRRTIAFILCACNITLLYSLLSDKSSATDTRVTVTQLPSKYKIHFKF